MKHTIGLLIALAAHVDSQVTLPAAAGQHWGWLVAGATLLLLVTSLLAYVLYVNRRLKRALSGYRVELSERRVTKRALRKSEQLRAAAEKLAAIGRLAAGVAHEINNPLTGVLTFSHLLRQKENLDEQDRKDLDLIIHETARASEIVRGLLDFARERPAITEPLDVNEVVRRALRLLGNQQASQQIELVEQLVDGLPMVDGDMNQLQQVLLNLSLNACEAMSEGGILAVSTSAANGKVLIRVTDTGCGINTEHIEHIFEPFFSTKAVGKGTGLGLSVSYGIIQQHGGMLDVESKKDRGTTFLITLPAATSDASPTHTEKVSL